MGCDGGTIPRRDELVRVKQKPEQKDKDAEREFRWLHCTISQQRLEEPVVMCALGRLYTKQKVIENLLEKDKIPESAKHIKNLKDIKDLKLSPNPAYTDEDKTEGLLDTRHSPYICKLIGLEMSGKFRFIALWSCGCVMSERGFKRIKTDTCPLCQTPYGIEDIIVLNGSEEDVELMKVKQEMRNEKRKESKKIKSNEKAKAAKEQIENNQSSSSNDELHSINQSTGNASEISNDEKPSTSKIKIVANIKRHGNEKSLQDPDLKRLKTDYSVAKDPKATDVYKSLFTSHKSEKEQTRAHWVTYNPFYN